MEATDKQNIRRRWRNLGGVALLFLALVAGYAFLAAHGLAIPCVFRRLTGLSCPGCGNTRAVMAFLRGEGLRALAYNYLAPLEFFYLGWVLFFTARSYLRHGRVSYRPPRIALDVLVLVALVAWGVLRNIF